MTPEQVSGLFDASESFVEGTQRLDGLARRLQRDARVEHLLDDLELDEIAIRVETLRTAAVRVHDRRADQTGARPVVELAVCDPDDLANLRTAVAGLPRVAPLVLLSVRLSVRWPPTTWASRMGTLTVFGLVSPSAQETT